MKQLSRRTAIRGIAAAIATASGPHIFPQSVEVEALVKNPGIQLYTVSKELNANVNGTLQALRKIGYEEVESAGFAGLSPDQFRNALGNAGIKCNSAHFLDIGEAEPEDMFEQANIVGVHYIVGSLLTKFNSKLGPDLSADDYKRMAEFYCQLGFKAKKAGLQFAYHNHNSEFKEVDKGKIGYDLFVEETDSELVKLELDCGWMMIAGKNPVDYFRRFPNRYRMIHIKDFVKTRIPNFSRKPEAIPQSVVLGTGFIQYEPILKAALKNGVEHFYVEQEPPFVGMTAMEAAAGDYEYLTSLSK